MSVRNLLTLVLTISFQFVFAQSYVEITGQTIDSAAAEVIPFAQLAIYDAGSKELVTGTTSDFDGNFKIRVKPGKYDFEFSYVGYRKVSVAKNVTQDTDLGKVFLAEDVEVMDEVVVQATEVRKPVLATLDGMEIRPDQTLSNTGGTLLDILRVSPSVRVGEDGSVSIRGSGSTNVLINGRNSSLTADLEQIPASAIRSIQIINNPNAKYDAAAAGGVINIVLKRGAEKQSSASLEVTGGTLGRTSVNARGSHSFDNLNIFGGYSYRNFPSVSSRSTERVTYSDNERLLQESEGTSEDEEHTINLGADFFIGQHKISYEGVLNFEGEADFQTNGAILSDMDNNDIITQYVRANTEGEDNYTYDNALIYEYLFNDNRQFRVLASNSYRDGYETQEIEVYQGISNLDENPGRASTGNERSFNDTYRTTSVIQADYSQPLRGGLFEAGYKSTFREIGTDYRYEILNRASGVWENQENVTNYFIYDEAVHAGYVIYKDSLGAFTYAAGVRGEGTLIDTELVQTGERNQQRYFDLFPSVQLAYNTNEFNTFKITYSRRIDRPGGWRLNPFPDVSDSLNVRIGNDNLQPEYINSFEVGHMYNPGRVSLTTNLFYRRVINQVDWIVQVIDGISFRGPQNLLSSDNYGIEVIGTWDIFNWWQINGSYSGFGVQVDGTNLDQNFTNSGLSWYVKFNSDFQLPYDIDVQITGNYEAPEIEAQGQDREVYYLDLSVQRDFFNEKLGLNVSLRDVFDTRIYRGENFGGDFLQTSSRKWQTQILLVSLKYNFL